MGFEPAWFSEIVSTHSRLKAAGPGICILAQPYQGFNTQSPEGGWVLGLLTMGFLQSFNTQPPEGGWDKSILVMTD